MQIVVAAVGRLKAGPERELAARYLDRAAKTGPRIGLTGFQVREVTEGRGASVASRRAEEAAALAGLLAPGAARVVLDERGAALASRDFADFLARERDGGRTAAAIVIGGPDGHDPAIRDTAALVVSFGAMTWPHQLVRVMLAEQLYRAVTLLSGHPYHRD
ncbi:23S rRNA (pseudouridine(1915)-N(3))-methyltransferase RlmH [Pseudoxanthobacter sp. M-2]|uniref:23S rRNA (pseudouridine(1915)-N(3))-methyltransferase RlmH n=1 Tax=Pseudoxanthobacter sp. M-2 TaxID=3078754 RepID=UPI0038FCC75D